MWTRVCGGQEGGPGPEVRDVSEGSVVLGESTEKDLGRVRGVGKGGGRTLGDPREGRGSRESM